MLLLNIEGMSSALLFYYHEFLCRQLRDFDLTLDERKRVEAQALDVATRRAEIGAF